MNTLEFVKSRPDIFGIRNSNTIIEVWARLLNDDYLVYRAQGKNFEWVDAFYDVFIADDIELDFGNRSIVKASFMLSEGV